MPLLERSGGQNVFGHACRSPASATEIRLAFAGMLQMPWKTGWRLQERCKCRGKLVGVCRNAANAAENWLAFAGTLQMPRKTGWRLQECCKCRGKLVGVCGTPASLTEIRLTFAGLPQVSRRYGWRLRESRKSHGDAVGVCGAFVYTLPTLFLHRTHVSLPLMNLIHLPRPLPFNLVHHLDRGLDGGFDLVSIEAARLKL